MARNFRRQNFRSRCRANNGSFCAILAFARRLRFVSRVTTRQALVLHHDGTVESRTVCRSTIAGLPNTQRPREHLRPSPPCVTALSTVTSASTRLFPRSPPPLRASVPHATRQAVLRVSHRPSPVSISGSTISATTTISVLGFDAPSSCVPPRCLAFARRFRPCSLVSHRSTVGSGFRSASGANTRPERWPGLPVFVSTRRH